MISKIVQIATDKNYRRGVLVSHGIIKISDEEYISELFYQKFGRLPNLNKPVSFNEKIQWLKLHDRKPIYTSLVDKYEVKEIVGNIIGREHIIPTLGMWEKFEDINFDLLPQQFVLKCTHDSGGNYICRDKEKLDYKALKAKIKKSLKTDFYLQGREWPYKNVKPRIIAEKYMEDDSHNDTGIKGLTDYKFFCFNGNPLLLYVSKGLEHHPTAEISFYDMDGNEMTYHRNDYKPYHNAFMPKRFSEMREIAHTLACFVNSPFVRIDLYSINDEIYFSEITFSPCSGMIPFEPISADIELGQLLKLPGEEGANP